MAFLEFNDLTWNRLLRIGKNIDRIANLLMLPFSRLLARFSVRLPKSKLWFRPVFLNEFYMALNLWEPYVRRVFRPKLGDIVVDIGAHIGYYTLIASRAVGSKGKVIAVEPDPRNISVLQKNIRANGLENVQLVKAAIGAYQGWAHFELKKNPLFSEVYREKPTKGNGLERIRIMTLNQLRKTLKLERVDWIKIDVEGGASGVLEGSNTCISSHTKILVEIPDEETMRFLRDNSFMIRRLLDSDSAYGYYLAFRDEQK